MNYELAKQLKDVGFPQEINEGSFYYTASDGPRFCWGGEGEDKPYREYVLAPSLSELIEACGLPLYMNCNTKGYWYALNASHSQAIRAQGTTPEEAVACLWLALHKKV